MLDNRRTQTILCGSAVNSVTAIVLVSFFFTVWSMLSSRDVKGVMMFPWWVWAVAIFAGPFSFATGLIGMALLTRVRRQAPPIRRYLGEATGLGALLGASYPAIAAVLRLDDLARWAFAAFGIACGAICGFVVGYLSIGRVLDQTTKQSL